jgi:predicted RecB family endonuclease
MEMWDAIEREIFRVEEDCKVVTQADIVAADEFMRSSVNVKMIDKPGRLND